MGRRPGLACGPFDKLVEFEDSALLSVFAAGGLSVFPVNRLGVGDVELTRGLRLLARCDEVKEEIHAIRSRRGQHHPLVMRILAADRQLMGSERRDAAADAAPGGLASGWARVDAIGWAQGHVPVAPESTRHVCSVGAWSVDVPICSA